MVRNATRDGYFRCDPTEEIAAVRKPSVTLKEFLEVDEYLKVIQRPAPPHIAETVDAFIFSLYSGLRWCDVKPPEIENGNLTTRIIQVETGQP